MRPSRRETLETLIDRARLGDAGAFEDLCRLHEPELLRYLTGFLRGDSEAAQDALQETLLQAWRHFGSILNVDHLRPWLFTVARCKAISWLRRRQPPNRSFRRLDGEGARCGPGGARTIAPRSRGPEEASELAESQAEVLRAIDGLPELYSGPIRLHYLHGYDTLKTARLLGIPRTCVKMRLHRGRIYLRRALSDRRAAGPSRASPRTPGYGR